MSALGERVAGAGRTAAGCHTQVARKWRSKPARCSECTWTWAGDVGRGVAAENTGLEEVKWEGQSIFKC